MATSPRSLKRRIDPGTWEKIIANYGAFEQEGGRLDFAFQQS
ncbi:MULTISPECIES: hypothetical protein [unclassified Microbacterium]|nr:MULTISPECIES: hypothetical protein [unclassified Microbacterium]